MSKMLIEDPKERAQAEREEALYARIMRDGKLDRQGFLIEPPHDMTDEEADYYEKLLKAYRGKIPYVV